MTKERQAWDQFLATGKVEDYLACVGKKQSVGELNKMEREMVNQNGDSPKEDKNCRSL